MNVAPGPRGLPLVGNLTAMWGDLLAFLVACRERYGDVVRLRLGPMLIHLVTHPEHIRQVLVTHQHNYNKATRSSAKISHFCGESLLTSNGEFWMRQRRLMQPIFAQQRLGAYTDGMIAAVNELLDRWRSQAATGRPLDVASEMMGLTFRIVGRALFGADLTGDVAAVEEAATVVMRHTYRKLEHLINIPLWLPTPGNLRFRQALRTLDRLVTRLIETRRTASTEEDVLTCLLRQRDEQTGQAMTAEQLRNESVTLLLAGHETTANALTWTWYLLAQHPEWAARVRQEVQEVLGGRPPTFVELSRLRYTTWVIQEAMRLYPPIWIMERRVLADDVLGGYRIPAGSTIALSPFVTHRNPTWWPAPEKFDPERFRPEATVGRQAYSYFPFGGGQRLCIGSHFAMMEATLIVALVVRAFRMELVAGRRIVPNPGITLRVRHGLHMTLQSLNAEVTERP